jgi:hypothetical protein
MNDQRWDKTMTTNIDTEGLINIYPLQLLSCAKNVINNKKGTFR